jgi:predicted metal-dependent hydrolase
VTRIEPEEQDFDPAEWNEGDAARHLREGVRLFNACEYRAAHEEFERVWLSTEGHDSDFYKGLIQACIALHHFQSGNLAGAAKLYGGHRRYLAAYLPRHQGVDVAAFLENMQRALRPVVRRSAQESPRFDAALRPVLTLGDP